MPKVKAKMEFSMVPKLGEDDKMLVDEVKFEGEDDMKAEEGFPTQRLSSRLKKKEVPDWSFLRVKKRGASALNADVNVEGSERKKQKPSVKKEKVEVKEEARLPTPVKAEHDRKPRAGKQTAIRVKPKQEQPLKDEKLPRSRHQSEEQEVKIMLEVVEEPHQSTSGNSKSTRPRRSRRAKATKKESSLNPFLPAVAKKEEDAEVKIEVKPDQKKGKKEQGLLTLELDTTARFKAAGISQLPLAIPDYTDAIHGVQVPRMFVSNTYGGATQQTFPNISDRRLALHGFNDFMFLNDDLHPLAPQVPGAPGVWINIAGGQRDKVMRVFVRVKGTSNPPLWWYVGQYELRNSWALTKEEWGSQTDLVKRAWADGIVRYGWGNGKRASIYGRKELGRTPTAEEIQGYLDSKAFEKSVTATDVLDAFGRGDETLNLFTMKCVAYDDAFQRDVAQKYPGWLLTHPPGN